MLNTTGNKTKMNGFKTAITGLALAASVIPFSACSKDTSNNKPPNIIFIMSDDHTEQAISCFGSTMINTPNIDRIANEGIRFTNSFVTNSICAPSRAVMLTGKYSHMNGKRDNQDEFDSSQETFPKLLQEEGYETAMIGKWHLESEPVGFDTYQILSDNAGQGVYYNPNFNDDGQITQYAGYATDIITDKAIDFLEQVKDSENPFCLIMNHKAPHRNWMPGPKYLGVFEDVEIPLPETFYDDYSTRELAALADMRVENMYLSQDMKLHKEYYGEETGTGGLASYAAYVGDNWEKEYQSMTEEQRKAWDAVYDPVNKEYAESNLSADELLKWKYQRYMRDYLACILSVDESIGKILEYLDENGLTENTIIVYTSDQGFYLGEHGWYDKRWMYEESLRMPLVMRYPAVIPAGQVTDEMVLNLDFAPTFLDLAHIEIPEEIQGKPLRTIISGNNAPSDWRTSIYYHYYEYPHGWHDVKRHFGVRTERYKLIDFYNDHYWELFDLKEDPNELNNIYENPEYADVVNELKEELTRLRDFYGDNEY